MLADGISGNEMSGNSEDESLKLGESWGSSDGVFGTDSEGEKPGKRRRHRRRGGTKHRGRPGWKEAKHQRWAEQLESIKYIWYNAESDDEELKRRPHSTSNSRDTSPVAVRRRRAQSISVPREFMSRRRKLMESLARSQTKKSARELYEMFKRLKRSNNGKDKNSFQPVGKHTKRGWSEKLTGFD